MHKEEYEHEFGLLDIDKETSRLKEWRKENIKGSVFADKDLDIFTIIFEIYSFLNKCAEKKSKRGKMIFEGNKVFHKISILCREFDVPFEKTKENDSLRIVRKISDFMNIKADKGLLDKIEFEIRMPS